MILENICCIIRSKIHLVSLLHLTNILCTLLNDVGYLVNYKMIFINFSYLPNLMTDIVSAETSHIWVKIMSFRFIHHTYKRWIHIARKNLCFGGK